MTHVLAQGLPKQSKTEHKHTGVNGVGRLGGGEYTNGQEGEL